MELYRRNDLLNQDKKVLVKWHYICLPTECSKALCLFIFRFKYVRICPPPRRPLKPQSFYAEVNDL